MMLHCFESGRTLRRPRAGMPALWSVGAHGALALSVMAPALMAPGDDRSPTASETVFLLPLLPTAPDPGASGMQVPLPFVGPGTAEPTEKAGDAPPAGGEEGHGAARASEAARGTAAALPDSTFHAGSWVFTEAELDEPVERDPSSAGPVYPEVLRTTGVQGEVTAEWVVDTVGVADSTTFRVVSSSHPLFTDAVRTVLPLMRFRPATLDGRHVRQFVRQQFRFELQMPAVAAADSASR